MSLHKYEIDVAVLLVFFARPDAIDLIDFL